MSDSLIQRFLRLFGLYTQDALDGVVGRMGRQLDAQRCRLECLEHDLAIYETCVGDIQIVREWQAAMPADAPPLMIAHEVKRLNDVIDGMAMASAAQRERRSRAAAARERDAAGKFLPAHPPILQLAAPTKDRV